MGAPDGAGAAAVRLESVFRSFGAIAAVADLSLEVAPGEVHGLCGHNGAGKSTVVKMLGGLLRPDAGEIAVAGRPVVLRSPQEAQAAGVVVVDQELSVVPVLTVADNVLLGRRGERLVQPPRAGRARARALLDAVGLDDVDPGQRLEELPIGRRQLVEIARALGREARVLILDEPTATLSAPEIEQVFAAVRRVSAAGCAVIYVSHRLDEVLELCDRVTVMRDGRLVATTPTEQLTGDALVEMMLGAVAARRGRAADERGAASGDALELDGLSVGGRVDDLRLTAYAGRIVGLAGQVGSGASDVLRAIAGLDPSARGRVVLGDRRLPLGAPGAAVRAGVAYVSNDRKGEGLFLGQPIEANLVSTRLRALSRRGVLLPRAVRRAAAELADVIGLDRSRVPDPVSKLSGGNQQKVLLGRSLHRPDVRVLLLDEPTRGVDVGGRADIHELVRAAAAAGAIVLFASTELDEILDLADTVVTMRDGAIVAERDRADVTAGLVLADMTHADPAEVRAWA